MSPRRRLVLLGAAVVVVVTAFSALVLMTRPKAVETLVANPRTAERVLAVVGRVRPIDLVEVRPIYPGQVVRLLHDEGDRVAAGAPLAVMRATVEQAEVQADLARVEAARARAVEARQEFERTRKLHERGFAARAALDQARAALRTAEAEARAAEATAQAQSARAREFIVKAPMASIVLSRPIDPGQVVSGETTLFELGTLAGEEVEAEIDEVYGDAIRPGMTARVAATGSKTVLAAVVKEVSPRVDASTGGRLVRLSIPPAPGLAPGRSVDATIVVRPAERMLLIPRQSVVDATVAPKVYVVGDDDVVQVRPVRIVDWPSTHAIVESGLKGGERIVLDPGAVEPGERIRPKPTPR